MMEIAGSAVAVLASLICAFLLEWILLRLLFGALATHPPTVPDGAPDHHATSPAGSLKKGS